MDKNVLPLLPLTKLDFLSREILLHRVTANVRDAAYRDAAKVPDDTPPATASTSDANASTSDANASTSDSNASTSDGASTGLILESYCHQPPIGTSVVQFHPVVGHDVIVESDRIQTFDIEYHCITCMKEYKGKSLEELRLEDYLAGRFGGVYGFQQKEDFTRILQQYPIFGTSRSLNQPGGTAIARYFPVLGTDVIMKSGTSQEITTKHHCITVMKQYAGKSFEELRLEDYISGRNSGVSDSRQGNPISRAKGSYWQRPQPRGTGHAKYYPVLGNGPIIKSGEKYGNIKYHAITFMHQYKDKSFEELRLEDYASGRTYGAIDMQQKESEIPDPHRGTASKDEVFNLANLRTVLDVTSKPGYWERHQRSGTVQAKFYPVVGVSPRTKTGSKEINERHHCITFMRQYRGKSFEELRLEDYMAGINDVVIGCL